MKIITINVPESYVKQMDSMIGEDEIYPSRSELVRVAVREFLIRLLNPLKEIQNLNKSPSQRLEAKDPNIIEIPLENGVKVYHIKKRPENASLS